MNDARATIEAIKIASGIKIDFDEDVKVFAYTNSLGEEWEGCLEEWIGNREFNGAYEMLLREFKDKRYYEIGASGGGADIVLVLESDSPQIYYYNDYGQTLSRVADSVEEFVSKLKDAE